MIDLRMLGVMKDVAFPALHRLLPWAILGFGTNLVTGMLFFVASPEQYVGNIAFVWKMILVMLAGANALYFTLFDEAWVLQPGDDAPFTAKAVAVSAIALWLGVLYFGSMLPFHWELVLSHATRFRSPAGGAGIYCRGRGGWLDDRQERGEGGSRRRKPR